MHEFEQWWTDKDTNYWRTAYIQWTTQSAIEQFIFLIILFIWDIMWSSISFYVNTFVTSELICQAQGLHFIWVVTSTPLLLWQVIMLHLLVTIMGFCWPVTRCEAWHHGGKCILSNNHIVIRGSWLIQRPIMAHLTPRQRIFQDCSISSKLYLIIEIMDSSSRLLWGAICHGFIYQFLASNYLVTSIYKFEEILQTIKLYSVSHYLGGNIDASILMKKMLKISEGICDREKNIKILTKLSLGQGWGLH